MPELFQRHAAVHLKLKLPMPPSVNHYWRTVSELGGRKLAHPRTLLSADGRGYQVAVQRACLHVTERATGRLRIWVRVCYRDKRRIDLDNRLKSLLDALTKAEVWEDDSQLDEITIVRGPVSPPDGHADIVIEALTP